MNAKQIDPKYHIDVTYPGLHDGPEVRIVKTSNGDAIPDDEPLILFRARDRNALLMLRAYSEICIADECTDYHMAGIENRIAAFEKFAAEHPERMKQPGITKGL